MNYLYQFGFSEKDIKDLLDINSNVKNLNDFDIENNILFLKKIGCNEKQIRNIIIANPFYLDRDIISLEKLENKLTSLGITNLEITFDSNPYLLNKDSFEIDEFIIHKLSKGMNKEDIIDLIDMGMMDYE